MLLCYEKACATIVHRELWEGACTLRAAKAAILKSQTGIAHDAAHTIYLQLLCRK